MNFRIAMVFFALCFATAGVHATIIYTVSDGTTTTTINPLAKAETAALYYDYSFDGFASGNPDFGPVNDKGFFWLYEDTNTGVLSLGMIFDKRIVSGGGTGGTMDMSSSGMPGTAFVSVSDEESPSGTFINGNDTWLWFTTNTDGGMISGLENLTWAIDLTLNSFTGLSNGFAFVNGPSPTGTSYINLALDNSGTSTLTITATEVPEPVTLALMGLGLAGLGFGRRKRLF